MTVSLLAMAVTGIVTAAVPSVYLSVVASPPKVTQGEPIGFIVTIDNRDNSTVSQPSVDATIPSGATFSMVYPSTVSCTVSTAGDVVTCSLANIPGMTSTSFAIVFTTTENTSTPATTTVTGYTTGAPADPGGNSHGDNFFCDPASACTASTTLGLTTDPNFYGGFYVSDAQSFTTSFDVGKTNKQATAVGELPTLGIGVSVEDGPGVGDLGVCGSSGNPDVTASVCSQLFGENSALYVGGNQDFYPNAFKVTILFGKYELAPGVNKNNIAVYHTWKDSSGSFHEDVIDTACTYDSSDLPTNAECLTAKKTSDGILVDIWVFHNGNMKGF
jgi:hypothetical protein